MKVENIELVKQAIINEYGVSDVVAAVAARAALEATGRALIALVDKPIEPKKEDNNEAD